VSLLPLLVSTLTYVGLALALAGAISLLKPLRLLRESAVGAVVCCRPTRLSSADQFRGLTQPGFAKAGMNFR
jgi:hypothetical protein